MIRCATIGTNFVADWFMKAVQACDGITCSLVYSRNRETAEAFCGKHGAGRWCTDLMEVAEAEDVDAVYIASPNSLHYEQAALMLSHGKHVLCEKTITSNEAELKELIRIAGENRAVLMEAMRSVHEEGFLRLREVLPMVGTIRRASFQYAKYSSRYDKFKEGIIENAFNPEFSNGALMDIGVYCVHPLVCRRRLSQIPCFSPTVWKERVPSWPPTMACRRNFSIPKSPTTAFQVRFREKTGLW